MELRHLRYFLAVAEEGQFTRAAERLAMQQPPLSQQIRLLEEEVGFDLFVRLPRGVELTPAGEAFARNAAVVLDTLQQGLSHARRIARGELGSISIGLTSSAGFHPLTTHLIRAFGVTHPDIEIELAELNAAELIERLLARQIHVAFLRKPTETPADLTFTQLLDEPMVVALPLGHPLLAGVKGAKTTKSAKGTQATKAAGAQLPALPLQALANENFILVRRPGAPGMYADFLSACKRAGFLPQVSREVPRMLTGIHMVAAGLGVTLVPASMRHYDHENVTFCALSSAHGLSAPLHLAYPSEMNNPAAARFVEFAQARLASGIE